MFFATLASAALAAVSVSAISIPRGHLHHVRHPAQKPDTYNEAYLEPYDVYHRRYMALDCERYHNSTLFNDCCHPLIATETLAKNRKPYCDPNHVVSTASAPASASSHVLAGGGDDDNCDDEDQPTTVITHPVTATPTSVDDDDCGDDEDELTTSVSHSSSTRSSTVRLASSLPTGSTVEHTSLSSSTTHHVTSVSGTMEQSSFSTQQSSSTSTSVQPSSTVKHTSTSQTSSSTPIKPASPPASDSNNGPFTGGQATFFFQGGQAGACGKVNQDTAFIAALQTTRYGNLGAVSSNCGRKITLTNTRNGKSVAVIVADACPTCGNQNDLDLSVAAFEQIATQAEGQVPIVWSYA